MNIDSKDHRESRGSVSYTDYYSNEDGQIRRTANDNCFPTFVKPSSGSEDSHSDNVDEPEEEDHTLTLKKAEEQKKRDVQNVFEKSENQSLVRPGSSYKKIGRYVKTNVNQKKILVQGYE